MRRPPDFFLIGAPKAGTSALHAALARHPGLYLSPVKEPKYYLCGDSPPPAYKGPGVAVVEVERRALAARNVAGGGLSPQR